MVAVSKNSRAMNRPAIEPSDDSYLGRVALRLKKLRTEAGLDPERAAKAITQAGYPVASSTVYRWEQGKTQPHIESLPSIAEAYGLKSSRSVLPSE